MQNTMPSPAYDVAMLGTNPLVDGCQSQLRRER